MNKFFKFFAFAALAMAFCSCSEEKDLCEDASYKGECIDLTHYMKCENGALMMTECAKNSFCTDDGEVTCSSDVKAAQ